MPPGHSTPHPTGTPPGGRHSTPRGAYRPTKSSPDTPGTFAGPGTSRTAPPTDRAEARQQERGRLRSCAHNRSLAFGEEGDLFQVSDVDCDFRIPLHYSLNDHVRLV